jgi:hypothetical protein
LAGHARRGHRLRRENSRKLPSVDQPSFAGQLRDAAPCLHRLLRDFRRRGVPDIGAQRRSNGRTAIEQLARALRVSTDAVDAPHAERIHRAPENGSRVNRVPRDHRHHHVQLELAGFAGAGNRLIAAAYLVADLVDHLGDRRIHFAGHD